MVDMPLHDLVELEGEVEAAYADLHGRLKAVLAKPGDQATSEDNAVACALEHAVTHLHNARLVLVEAFERNGLVSRIKP